MKKGNRLKIGLFIDNFFPSIDGVVIAVDNLAKELSEHNDVVVVVPSQKNYKKISKPYKIKRIIGTNIPFTEYQLVTPKFSYSKYYKELLDEKFDIIHIHSPFSVGKLGIKIAKEQNIPSIGTVHTRFNFEIEKIIKVKFLTNFLMKEIIDVFNECDECFVVNDPLIEEIKQYGYKYEPVVVYNGTDLKPIRTNKNSFDEINKKYGLTNQENVLLFVGRITDVKNIYFILDCLKLLKEDNVDFKMLYVGSGPDEKKLKSKIKEYKMADSVIMTGRISDRKELSLIYKRADLLLFPSLFDTSALVRIEAAVNETVGLFIDNSMIGLTVQDGINGFTSTLVEKEYTAKIKEILSDKVKLKKASKKAKKTLAKSWKEVAKETYNLYLKEIKQNKS